MSEAKLVVIYPRPKSIEAFEKIYIEEHVPLAVAKLSGKTKIVATKITSSPEGTPPFYRIAEIYFPSKAALEACAATPGAQEALVHAVKISTGGAPIFLIAEEETFTFTQSAGGQTMLRGPRMKLELSSEVRGGGPADELGVSPDVTSGPPNDLVDLVKAQLNEMMFQTRDELASIGLAEHRGKFGIWEPSESV